MKKTFATFALTVILAACGGGGSANPPAPPSSTPVTTPATPAASPDSAAPTSLAPVQSADATGTTGTTGTTGSNSAPTADVGASPSGTGTGIASNDGGTGSTGSSGSSATGEATASNGTSGSGTSGVGSGGTGINVGEGPSTGTDGNADAEGDGVGIGAVSGFGSVIVNGVRFDTSATTLNLEDLDSLKLGMTLRITGRISADRTQGTATSILSAAELRGPVSAVNAEAGTLQVLGTTVTTDEATVYEGASGVQGLRVGMQVMVHGFPTEPGSLRASRIEVQSEARPAILTGFITSLDPLGKTLRIGTTTVSYRDATLGGGWTSAQLQEGELARVRAGNAPQTGPLAATSIQPWYTLPTEARAQPMVIGGIVAHYQAGSGFKLAGVAVALSSARITGGPATALGNGVKVEVTGTLQNGVFTASGIQLKHIAGTGGPASFSLIGTVGAFRSVADFKVKGQPVNASLPGVVFNGGSAAQLRNGAKVTVTGDTVVNGVLQAQRVDFH